MYESEMMHEEGLKKLDIGNEIQSFERIISEQSLLLWKGRLEKHSSQNSLYERRLSELLRHL
jgi:hypothetical protein